MASLATGTRASAAGYLFYRGGPELAALGFGGGQPGDFGFAAYLGEGDVEGGAGGGEFGKVQSGFVFHILSIPQNCGKVKGGVVTLCQLAQSLALGAPPQGPGVSEGLYKLASVEGRRESYIELTISLGNLLLSDVESLGSNLMHERQEL